jgi:hypothetical protein
MARRRDKALPPTVHKDYKPGGLSSGPSSEFASLPISSRLCSLRVCARSLIVFCVCDPFYALLAGFPSSAWPCQVPRRYQG